MQPTTLPRRRPEFLSPSALACYEAKKEEYYIRYIAPTKAPPMPQTQPMAVGSSFDAHVKSYLHSALYGAGHPEAAKYSLDALIESQVESHCRDAAVGAGKYVFDQYKSSGALSDLMLELQSAVDEPRFEFDIKGVVSGYREGITASKMGVPLRGKPDIRFTNSHGAAMVYDWKVSGFYSRTPPSPMPGYIELRDGKGTRFGSHKDAFIQEYRGIRINAGAFMETYKKDWATQLATYAWLLGSPVGSEDIFGVDQVVGKKNDFGVYPDLRFASHRLRISANFQFGAMSRYQGLWSVITSDPLYFFTDMSFEDSERKCQGFDRMCWDVPAGSDAEWMMNMGRHQ